MLVMLVLVDVNTNPHACPCKKGDEKLEWEALLAPLEELRAGGTAAAPASATATTATIRTNHFTQGATRILTGLWRHYRSEYFSHSVGGLKLATTQATFLTRLARPNKWRLPDY